MYSMYRAIYILQPVYIRVVAVSVKRLGVICHTDLTSYIVILHYISCAQKIATVNDGLSFGSTNIQAVFVLGFRTSR